MNIKITPIGQANAVTHAGVPFHADEIFATAILGRAGVVKTLARVFKVEDEMAENVDIVYDIGGGQYDHHQRGGNGNHADGTPYAACGLIWRDYGRLLCSCPDVERMVEDALIKGIDAIDNGVATKGDCMSISAAISAFNPTWDSDESSDEAFLRACNFAEIILCNAITSAESKVRAKNIVEQAICAAEDGVMILPTFAPWQEYLLTSEAEMAQDISFVVFPSNRGGYNWQGVPAALGSFELRKPVDDRWKGATASEIRAMTGVNDCTFVHQNGFLGCCSSLQGAVAMAKEAAAERPFQWAIGGLCDYDISDVCVKAVTMEEAIRNACLNGTATIAKCVDLGIDVDI